MGDTLLGEIGVRAILLDGGMGSTITSLGLKPGDFGDYPGCNEILNRTRPDLIAEVHRQFYESGSDYVETNTFGGTALKLEEYGLADDAFELNRLAAQIARGVADEKSGRGVIGSVGPSGQLPSSPSYDGPNPSEITLAFKTQAQGLIDGGVDILLVETSQDILEVKCAVIGCRDAFVKCGREIPIWLSVSLHMNGRMLLGTSIDAALAVAQALRVDAFGINCATGPAEMVDAVRYLVEHSPLPVIVFPNQGIPENVDGEAIFRMTPDEFSSHMEKFLSLGVEIAGGCCGTTPPHIKALDEIRNKYKPRKIPDKKFALASAVISQEIIPEGSPLIIGERLNTLGSRKFKKLLENNDWNGIVEIANRQAQLGAMALDLSLAVTDRETEVTDYQILVHRLSSECPLPLMIDSVNPEAVHAALEQNPGVGIVNSINLEKKENAEYVTEAVARFGGAVVAMLIDENGMAKDVETKISIAKQLYELVVNENGLSPESILFDPLTFTLATGEDELKNSAVATLDGVKALREQFPECGVVLGISNVSYGLPTQARKILNAVFLHHAIKAGLTAAIVNPLDVTDYHDFTVEEIELAEDLLFNRSDGALERMIAYAEGFKAVQEIETSEIDIPLDEQLSRSVLERRESGVEDLIDKILETREAVEIVNEILMPAMKEVGDRMERRESILPHVLRSAEVMSRALEHLEKHLGKSDIAAKKKFILATVFGDVHDIGKNLVKAIVSNNGYDVIDLGKQVLSRDIVEAVRREKPMAVGLSALLVATSREMEAVVRALHEEGLAVPVLIGGAAVSRGLADKISEIDGEKYAGGVFYARDAFDALNTIRKLDGNDVESQGSSAKTSISFGKKIKSGETASVNVEKPEEPPFFGNGIINFNIGTLLENLREDEITGLSSEPEIIIGEVKGKLGFVELMQPCGIFGFYRSSKSGLEISVAHDDGELVFRFPDKKKTVPKWLADDDYVIPYVATLGVEAAKVYSDLESGGHLGLSLEWAELCSVLAEVTARSLRGHIAINLSLPENTNVLGVSPGYAMWPDLEDQRKLEKLLEWSRIGLSLTERNQIVPEFSTSGLAIIHPDAKY